MRTRPGAQNGTGLQTVPGPDSESKPGAQSPPAHPSQDFRLSGLIAPLSSKQLGRALSETPELRPVPKLPKAEETVAKQQQPVSKGVSFISNRQRRKKQVLCFRVGGDRTRAASPGGNGPQQGMPAFAN